MATDRANTEKLVAELEAAHDRIAALEAREVECSRTEGTLLESEVRLNSILESTTAGYFRIDKEGMFKEVNKAWLRMHGYDSKEEIIDRHFSITQTKQELDQAQEVMSRLLSGEPIPQGEFSRHNKDGSTGYHTFSVHPIMKNGKPVELEGFLIDITDRKRAEEALAKKEEHLRLIVENTDDMIILHDREGRYLYYNGPIISSLRPDEVEGKTPHDFFDNATADALVQRIKEAFQYGKRANLESFFRWGNRENWYSEFIYPILDKDGNVIEVARILRNITEKKRAEQSIELHIQRLVTLVNLDQMNDVPDKVALDYALEQGIRLTGSTHGFVGFLSEDETALNIHAWSKSVMKDCSTLDKPLRLPLDKVGCLGEAVRRREPFILNDYLSGQLNRKVMPDGHVEIKRLLAIPVLEGDSVVMMAAVGNKPEDYGQGDVNQLILLFRGVWDIIKKRRGLEALQTAKETAEAANQAKSDFLAHMSHEIRTPISGILGMADLAAHSAVAPEVKEYLKHVKDSGKKLLGIINDVLDLSKIEAGKLDIVPTLFDLREMLEKTLPPFSLQARQKGIDFSCHIAAEVPGWLEGDPIRLGQVINNVLGNALKYTEQGKVEMTVGLEAPPESHTVRLLVQVRDTGIGIPEDKLELVFESFEQVDRSSTRRFQGTGLGLAISKRLVEMMGGRIWAESEPGKGSIFFFMIPFANGSEIGAEAEETQKIVAGQKESRWNVLVVEDDEVNRKFVELFLRQKGHHSVGAANGQEALKALEGERFDAVFMDIQMADMDGFEVTQLIRSGKSGVNNPDIPIIALTAYAMDSDRAKALDAGMDEYIAKPVDVNTLEDILARVLDK